MEISEIKSKLTLSAVLSYYQLKPDKNLRLNCPFHEDKTPSLQVYYKTHTAYCFSSRCKTHGKSLDVIDFILHKESCTKAEAIVKAQGLINPLNPNPKKGDLTGSQSRPVPINISREMILQNMFTYFKNAVHNSKPAQEYIKSRALDATKIEVGYNTAQFHHGSRREEQLINNCVSVGLLSPWGTSKTGEQAYKAFAKFCICFPLKNRGNHITGLYFRSSENNTDQKHFYLKESTGLYPCYPAGSTQKLIIAESIIDTASLLQIESITKDYSLLAAYGTNRLNDEMKTVISELNQLKEIVFAFDNDEAGHKAVEKYSNELQQQLPNVIFSKLDLPCKDVNETLQAHNEDVFMHLLENRTFLFSTEKEKTPTTETLAHHQITKSSNEFIVTNPNKLIYTTQTATYYLLGGLPKQLDMLKVMLQVENKQGFKSRN